MGTIILTRALSMGITASILLNIFTDLLPGAISGIIAGLVIGAIIVPLMQVPDALGRALLFGAVLGVLMAGYQLFQILSVTGGSLGSMLDSVDNSAVGQVILNGIIYVIYAVLAGCLIGVFITVPGDAIKGGLIGMLFGVIVGTALYWLLGYLDVNMNINLFRLLTGLLIFGVLTAITGRS